ncbi:MAG: hypothetical protein R2834_03075 [Rhodothermales bacterium]
MKSHRSALLAVLWLAIAAYPLIEGFAYYHAPLQERPYMAAHTEFRPSGFIGQGLGIIGSLMMLVGVSTYMFRKRSTMMQKLGKLRGWLTFHIFLCTLGPFLVLLHTTFKFGNIASISFWSMAIVVGSGIFGRYVYVHIPKTANGQFYTASDLKRAQSVLGQRLAGVTGLAQDQIESLFAGMPAASSIPGAVVQTLRFQLGKRRLQSNLEGALQARGVDGDRVKTALPLFLNHIELQLRQQTLGPFVRAFGYWHVLHIPLALVMLAAFLIHIAVAIAFGYTWVL